MVSDKTFFHLGLPKTGTTTLQHLLKTDDRINYSGKRTLAQFRHWEEPFQFKKSGKVNILSEENLLLQMEDLGKPHLLFKRINELDPNAEIIITIREQRDLLESRYKYNFPWYGGYNKSFNGWLRSGLGMEYLSYCMYASLYKMLRSFFKKENIHFLLFEQLKDKPEQFYNDFYHILGITKPEIDYSIIKNRALSEKELLVLKTLNKFKVFRKKSKSAKYELKLFLKIASLWKNNRRKYKQFRWDNLRYHKINQDFINENDALVKAGLFERGTLEKYGYLMSGND